MFPTWAWFVLGAGLIFLSLRIHHYIGSRRDENHDSYLVIREVCSPDGLKYRKCPNLEMWGLKWSIIITLLVINSVIVLALYFR